MEKQHDHMLDALRYSNPAWAERFLDGKWDIKQPWYVKAWNWLKQWRFGFYRVDNREFY